MKDWQELTWYRGKFQTWGRVLKMKEHWKAKDAKRCWRKERGRKRQDRWRRQARAQLTCKLEKTLVSSWVIVTHPLKISSCVFPSRHLSLMLPLCPQVLSLGCWALMIYHCTQYSAVSLYVSLPCSWRWASWGQKPCIIHLCIIHIKAFPILHWTEMFWCQ